MIEAAIRQLRSARRTAGIRRHAGSAFAACLVAAAVLVAIPGPATAVDGAVANETTLAVSDETVEPDGTTTARISLDRVPAGLAGFNVTLAFETDDVARVTNASYPDRFEPTSDPVVAASGRTVTIEGADLRSAVQPGATNVTLATVALAGTERGSTALTVSEMQVDADDGSKVAPTVESGSVSVGTASQGDGESRALPATNDGDGPTQSWILPGIGAAVLVVVAGLAVFVRRR